MVSKGKQHIHKNYKTPLSPNGKLIAAAEIGYFAGVISYIKDGANINAKESKGAKRTALLIAVKNRHLKIVNHLIDLKVDLNECDCHGRTALHVAARHNFDELVKLLLLAGANHQLLDKQGHTPLDLALLFNSEDRSIKLLIEAEAMM